MSFTEGLVSASRLKGEEREILRTLEKTDSKVQKQTAASFSVLGSMAVVQISFLE